MQSNHTSFSTAGVSSAFVSVITPLLPLTQEGLKEVRVLLLVCPTGEPSCRSVMTTAAFAAIVIRIQTVNVYKFSFIIVEFTLPAVAALTVRFQVRFPALAARLAVLC